MATMFDLPFHERLAQFALGEAAAVARQQHLEHLRTSFERNNWNLPPALQPALAEADVWPSASQNSVRQLGDVALGGQVA